MSRADVFGGFDLPSNVEAPREPDEPAVPVFFHGWVRLLSWSLTSERGLVVRLALEGDESDFHPFKGVPAGTSYGARFDIGIEREVRALSGERGDLAYSGEALLLRWADDSTYGMSANFELDATIDGVNSTSPFAGLPTGKKAGERLFIAVWALDDDGKRLPEPQRRKRPSNLNDVRQSQLLAKDIRFSRWLFDTRLQWMTPDAATRLPDHRTAADEYAGEAIRIICGIDSRSVLGQPSEAGARARAKWRSLVAAYERERRGC